MTELKTLKDFVREPDKGFRCKVDGKWLPRIVDGVELRMEAIKWYKREYNGTAEDWIKMFFGLSKEDLK